MTEFLTPRRVTAGNGIEKGILTAGDLRKILVDVSDNTMVTAYIGADEETGYHHGAGGYHHVDVVERPDPDPSGTYECDPDGPQLLVLNLGAPFDTRDF